MILLLFIINVILCLIYKTLYCKSGHMGESIYGAGMTYGFRHPLVRRDAGREGGTEGGIDGGMEGARGRTKFFQSVNI